MPDPRPVFLLGLSSDPLLVIQVLRPLARRSPEHGHCVRDCLEILSPSPWNTLIRAHSHASGDSPREALPVYLRMQGKGIGPNAGTIPFVLKSCACASALELGRGVHGEVYIMEMSSLGMH
ncbi:hypothetical protein SAY87_021980 [Trapa incisa]|uniref:Uncharacterized protein n=1 Tax=Trapa incisa TaxID=236973 RepID=A0AAN7PRM8_9MYRT|nr:hypothetical protein SAY87_021980 [Trapa incisa]